MKVAAGCRRPRPSPATDLALKPGELLLNGEVLGHVLIAAVALGLQLLHHLPGEPRHGTDSASREPLLLLIP